MFTFLKKLFHIHQYKLVRAIPRIFTLTYSPHSYFNIPDEKKEGEFQIKKCNCGKYICVKKLTDHSWTYQGEDAGFEARKLINNGCPITEYPELAKVAEQ